MKFFQTLSKRDQRTLQLAAMGITAYLVIFGALTGWKRLEKQRSDYTALLASAYKVKREVMAAENKVLLAQKLQETLRLDPRKLNRVTVVADASAALQKAAQEGGLQVGPVRETAARSTAKELTSIQLEANGPITAVLNYCARLESLGFPLIIDSLQITADPARPGALKVNLTVILLDYEASKPAEPTHA